MGGIGFQTGGRRSSDLALYMVAPILRISPSHYFVGSSGFRVREMATMRGAGEGYGRRQKSMRLERHDYEVPRYAA